MTARKYVWRIVWAERGTREHADYLADGWEPFAVDAGYIWFRKRTLLKAEDAR